MDDDWDLSLEELDSIENNAKRQLADRQKSSFGASVLPSGYPISGQYLHRPPGLSSPMKQTPHSPSKSSGRMSKSVVKFFMDQPGRIGVQTVYNKHLVAGLKMVPGHEWDAIRRVWTYPANRYEEVVSRITTIPEIAVDVEATLPLTLPSSVMQETRQTEPNQWPLGSPSKVSQRSQVNYPDQVEQQILSSPPRLQIHTASPQKSPMKGKGSGLVVQLYLMNPDHVAVKSPYNEKIKEACQSMPGRTWNAEDKVWVVPRNKMEELVQALHSIPVTVEAAPPLCIPATLPVRTEELRASQPDRESAPTSSQTKQQPPELPKYLVKLCLHHSGDIAARFDYNAKIVAAVRCVPKADWNPKERLWLFPPSSLPEAEKILSSISDLVVNVEGLEPLIRRAIEVTAAAPNMQGKYSEIPGDLESKLLQFQRDGVRFALQHGCRVLIADEMGLGKTLQAIAVASCLGDDWPVLIVVPSSLRLQWATSLRQWLDVRPADITVVMSQCSGSNKEGFNIVHSAGKNPAKLDGLFNIVSYDSLTKLTDAISEVQFKIVIADEAHYLKNAQAKRTNACVPLLQKAKYAVLLTGTPALSRPIELFKQLEALQPTVYKSVHEFGNRYCLGGNFGMYQGSSNLQELHTLVKSTVMIRRLKRDVLSELPVKRRQQVVVSLDDKGIRHMRALFNELEEIKTSIKRCVEDEDEKLKYAEKQLLNKIYTESAVVKLPAVQEYLSTIIDAECKFLIFAHHKSMLDGIDQLLMKRKVGHIRIDGETPQSARQVLVNRFQENDNIFAAVLGIRAAGVGVTLTAASTVIFAEMSWTPGTLSKLRIGLTALASSVNVYYLHAHDTIDDIIWETVQHKLENLGQVLDGQEDTLQVTTSQKTHVTLPRGQGTLHSYVQSGPSNQPCEGTSSSAPGNLTLTAGHASSPSLAQDSTSGASGDIHVKPGTPTESGGQGYQRYTMKRHFDSVEDDGSAMFTKRKRLF